MNDNNHLSLREQIEAYQAELAGRVSPDALERTKARRAHLVESGIAKKSLKVGDSAPDFTLPDAYGQPVSLSDLLAHGPVVLAFYRGDWCPYCNLTLRAYQRILPEISAAQATLVAVSPQNPDHTLLTVENKELTYPVLSDVGNRVARLYRLVWSVPEDQRSTSARLPEYNGDDSWELPIPGTFVISSDGRIELASVDADWTHRLEPQVIVETLGQLALAEKSGARARRPDEG